jgi:hypothetical protein
MIDVRFSPRSRSLAKRTQLAQRARRQPELKQRGQQRDHIFQSIYVESISE